MPRRVTFASTADRHLVEPTVVGHASPDGLLAVHLDADEARPSAAPSSRPRAAARRLFTYYDFTGASSSPTHRRLGCAHGSQLIAIGAVEISLTIDRTTPRLEPAVTLQNTVGLPNLDSEEPPHDPPLRARLGLRRPVRADGGMAMAITLIFGMVLVIMAATALTVATSGLQDAVGDQDLNAALAAAYAGVEEYQARLAERQQLPAVRRLRTPRSATRPAARSPAPGTQTNKAFGHGPAGTWADGAGQRRPALSSGTRSTTRSTVDRVAAHPVDGQGRWRHAVASSPTSARRASSTTCTSPTSSPRTPALTAQHERDSHRSTPGRVAPSGQLRRDRVQRWRHHRRPRALERHHARLLGDLQGGVTTADPTVGRTYAKVDSNNSACSGQNFDKGVSPARSRRCTMPDTNNDKVRETRTDLPTERPAPRLPLHRARPTSSSRPTAR